MYSVGRQEENRNSWSLFGIVQTIYRRVFPLEISIPRLSEGLRAVLDRFVSRGQILQHSTQSLRDNIVQYQKAIVNDAEGLCLFYFASDSSGAGKSQLAMSLGALSVIYIPLAQTQELYRCFSTISLQFQSALREDFRSLGVNAMRDVRSKILLVDARPFRSVGLLVALLRLVQGKSNEESIRLLSGHGASRKVRYISMTLTDARKEVKDKGLTSLIVLDEVPPKVVSDQQDNDYNLCIFARNVIRCMSCVCLLSGTEASAMNTIDDVSAHSRGDSLHEYLRLVVKLPATDWRIFENDVSFSELLRVVSPDVIDMLKQSRPLFVQWTLEAMLKCGSNGKLNSMVLWIIKQRIMSEKRRFSSKDGLYAQLCLMHTAFLEATARAPLKVVWSSDSEQSSLDEGVSSMEKLTISDSEGDLSPVSSDSSRKRDRESVGDQVTKRRLLEAELQICIRHHFGKLVPANDLQADGFDSSPTLSLFLSPLNEVNTMCVKRANGNLESFCPNVIFASPREDPLMYLICLRNGVHYSNSISTVRISTTAALLKVFNVRTKNPTFRNVNQHKGSGHYLEMEMVGALVTATHSQDSLCGSGLDCILSSIIAELNHSNYVEASCFSITGMPEEFKLVKVCPQSSADASWDETGGPSVVFKQCGELALTEFSWSKNGDRKDGLFYVMYHGQLLRAAVELKCYPDKAAPTDTLIKTILNTKDGKVGVNVTIMVVTKGVEDIRTPKFNEAKVGCTVARIRGDASAAKAVGTSLTWEVLHDSGSFPVNPLVIQVDLESIFFGRNDAMKNTYYSN